MSCIHSVAYMEGVYHNSSHWHATDQMLLILDGEAELHISEQHYIICQPSVVFISHLENHTFLYTTESYRRYIVDILPNQAHRRLADSDRLLSPFLDHPDQGTHVFPVGDSLSALTVLFQILYDEHTQGGYGSGETALLQTILQYLSRRIPEAFPHKPDPMTKIVRQLQQQLDTTPQKEESLAELANTHHLSISYLAHSFKKITGYSIGQYRLFCRIAQAKTLLTHTDLPVSEVGIQCGFPDASNFSRYFRREVGKSPSAFRKSYIDPTGRQK